MAAFNMFNKNMCRVLMCLLLTIFTTQVQPQEKPFRVTVGVVRVDDPYFYIDCFGPTIEYLRKKNKELEIITKEISVETSSEELANLGLDFLISPSGFFASHVAEVGLRQLVTRKPENTQDPSHSVGSTFVTLNDFKGDDLLSLKAKRAVAYDQNSLAGWLSAAGEIVKAGHSQEDFFSSLLFTNYAFPSPLAYLTSGKADVAILPSCDFEKLTKEGKYKGLDLKVVNKKENNGQCVASTQLYPDVVFSSFPNATPELVKLFSLSLLTMPKNSDQLEWSIANDFRGVHQLFQSLGFGPYANKGLSIGEIIKQFKNEIIIFVCILFGLILHTLRANHLVWKRTSELRLAIEQRDAVALVAKDRLKRLNQIEKRGMVSQMSSIIAHELKQPLSSVYNYSKGIERYLIQTGATDGVIKEAISEIQKGIKRAADIVDRVRSYSKTDTDTRVVICSLKEIASKAVASFEAYVSWSRKVEVCFSDKCLIEADPLEIELLIINLLRNSAEATESLKDKGIIKCSVTSDNDFCTVSVEDNGPKIPYEKLQKMRSALQETVKAEGLGLGLSIVMGIAEKYSGKIQFEQLPKNGLKVSVVFKKAG